METWGGEILRSEKMQNKSFPKFSNFRPQFCPEFCSEFASNFLRSFCASLCGRRRPEKFQHNSPPFFNAKFTGKFEEKSTKVFWRLGKVRDSEFLKIFESSKHYL